MYLSYLPKTPSVYAELGHKLQQVITAISKQKFYVYHENNKNFVSQQWIWKFKGRKYQQNCPKTWYTLDKITVNLKMDSVRHWANLKVTFTELTFCGVTSEREPLTWDASRFTGYLSNLHNKENMVSWSNKDKCRQHKTRDK